jgi:hypothetical protein
VSAAGQQLPQMKCSLCILFGSRKPPDRSCPPKPSGEKAWGVLSDKLRRDRAGVLLRGCESGESPHRQISLGVAVEMAVPSSIYGM